MARITIIDGHPDPDRSRYVHALADAYAAGADIAGHVVRRIDVATIDVPILRSAQEWRSIDPPGDIHRAQGDIRWADHLVILYPLWLGDMPALLKAFFEQTMRPGFAIEDDPSGAQAKLLTGISARVVVTMGMPAPLYRLFYRAHSLKSLERNLLRFVGIAPVRTVIIGSIDTGPARRRKWLRTMGRLGEEAR